MLSRIVNILLIASFLVSLPLAGISILPSEDGRVIITTKTCDKDGNGILSMYQPYTVESSSVLEISETIIYKITFSEPRILYLPVSELNKPPEILM